MLINQLSSIGLIVDHPVLDGTVYRVPTVEKPKGRNGWYVGRTINDRSFCTFGRWDTGEKVKWRSDNVSKLSTQDASIIKFISDKANQERKEKNERAADLANNMASSGTYNVSHPYLDKKNIKPLIGFVYGNFYCVPIFKGSQLVNLQKIYPDGKKKFLYGGEISGCASQIAGDDKICICEGFATGCSIHLATGYRVFIAFSAGNLLKVAKQVREKNKNADIIICADNDRSNTGKKFGRECANKVNAAFRMPSQVGFDFNDVANKLGLEAVKDILSVPVEIVSTDYKRDNISLIIPEYLYKDKGLISTGVEACSNNPEISNIIQYNFPVVLSVIARAIAGKIRFGTQWPVFYNIKVGNTSTGKTDVDIKMKHEFLLNGMDSFFGQTDFSSGPGLLRSMSEPGFEQCLVTLDEVTSLFKRPDKTDTISAGKISTLLELYTAAGTQLRKPYGDSKKNVLIDNPCLILVGNATPCIFDELRMEDLSSGTLQRFDFWVYDGPVPYRNMSVPNANTQMTNFIDGIKAIFNHNCSQKTNNKKDLRNYISCAKDIGADKDCQQKLQDYSHKVIDQVNSIDDPESGGAGIVSRRFHLAIKYALIHIAATRPLKYLCRQMTIEDLEWGIAVAEMLSDWKLSMLPKKITSGDFHKDCEIFKDAIAVVMSRGKKPTGRAIADRRRRIKQLKPKEFNDIVQALKARKEIVVDDSGQSTLYWLKN